LDSNRCANTLREKARCFLALSSGRNKAEGDRLEKSFSAACQKMARYSSQVAAWPNFFIVGAANSGTTSLYTCLNQHPQVFLPALKEPHYFAHVRPSYEQRYMRTYVTGESAYLRLFHRGAGYPAIGEASPSYLFDVEAAARIRRVLSHAKIIMLLRDPVERAHSHYLMDLREGVQREHFYRAIEEDWYRRQKGWGVSHLYVELGLYAAQVRRYLSTFGSKQVLILMFEELRRASENGKSALARAFRFLEVDPEYLDRIDTTYAENSYGVARWSWARRLAGSNRVRRLGQILVPPSLGSNQAVKRLIFQRFFVKSAPRPEMDPRAKDLLCSIFDPDIRALEELLQRHLPDLRHTWEARPAVRQIRKVAI
jgi:Sulfotransferase domain